ncbi:MAG: hypothetical protein ACP5VR_01805 [Acidimicrobiales bacterium]
MSSATTLQQVRVGWSAYAEMGDPLATLAGWLLRQELASRLPGLSPLLAYAEALCWDAPGFTGEPVLHSLMDAGGQPAVDVLVASGDLGPGEEAVTSLAEAGVPFVPVAPYGSWPADPRLCVGPPFAVPEPVVLAARHLSPQLLGARGAFLRVVHGLGRRYVLVDQTLLAGEAGQAARDGADQGDGVSSGQGHGVSRHRARDGAGQSTGVASQAAWPVGALDAALQELAEACAKNGSGSQVDVVPLVPSRLRLDDPEVEAVLLRRRAEVEEGRYQPEDWPGYERRPRLALRVTSPFDLAAAVAGAEVVVAASGALMALAWSLGVPHVALAGQDSTASAFAAWTGDATAVVSEVGQLVGSIGHVLARRGKPPGLGRLEATVDRSLDEAAATLGKMVDDVVGSVPGEARPYPASAERAQELQVVNDALRRRLAAERLVFGERAALLERAANTTVESAVKAVQGQDVVTRRRLEVALKEMKRLQDETAQQQAELRAIHSSLTWRAISPAREWYERLRKGDR